MFLSLPSGIWKAGSAEMGNANAERRSCSQWQGCCFCHSGANSWPQYHPQDAPQIQNGPKIDSREVSQLEENFHWGIKFSCGWICKPRVPLAPWSPRGVLPQQKMLTAAMGSCAHRPCLALGTVLKEGWGGSESCNFRYFSAQSEGNVSILVRVHSLPSAVWAVEKRW